MRSISIIVLFSLLILGCSSANSKPENLVRSSDPIESSQQYVDMGKQLMSQREFYKAKLKFLKASELDPDNYKIWGLAGVAAKYNSEYDEAIRLFSKVLEMRPTDYRAYGNIGAINQRLKRYDEAEKAFLRVMELNDKDFMAPMHLADIYYETAEYDKCQTYIKKFETTVEIMNKGVLSDRAKRSIEQANMRFAHYRNVID